MATSSSIQDPKVKYLIDTYDSLKALHPVVAKIYETPELKRTFWKSLTHDLYVINRRSPNLADCEITAAQKAFSTLMRSEEGGVAAIGIYVEEVLGLKFVKDVDKAQTLATTVQLRNCMLDATESRYQVSACSGASSGDLSISPQTELRIRGLSSKRAASTDLSCITENLFVSDGSDASQNLSSPNETFESVKSNLVVDESSDPALKPSEEDVKLKRLLLMFQEAKNDFCDTPPKSINRTKSAKFLRDTIENTLAYIATNQLQVGDKKSANVLESSTLDDLQVTLKEARAVAEQGSGGKKRRFDGPQGMTLQANAGYSRNANLVPLGRAFDINVGQRDIYRPPTQHGLPLIAYDQHCIYQARLRRSVSPFHRYPATIGQSVSRVFPRIEKSYTKRKQSNAPRRADCYRPAYK